VFDEKKEQGEECRGWFHLPEAVVNLKIGARRKVTNTKRNHRVDRPTKKRRTGRQRRKAREDTTAGGMGDNTLGPIGVFDNGGVYGGGF
jgi:hypothetical protein